MMEGSFHTKNSNMDTFTAKLIDVQKIKFPIVKAAFLGKDGKYSVGAIMIDTGSASCILNKSVLPYLDSNAIIEGKTLNVHSVQGEKMECQGASLVFRIGNKTFSDIFYINIKLNFDRLLDCQFIGIIGHQFLIRNNLVLDYETETLHTSERRIDDNIENYAFIFPMSFGLNQYNIPVIGLVYGEKEFMMVADSGADETVITKYMMDQSGNCVKRLGESGTVTYFTADTLKTALYDVILSIVSIGGTVREPRLYTQNDTVQVISKCQHIIEGLKDAEGNDLIPISGLLSSGFMLRNKWVLDFGTGMMYQRKDVV